MSPVPLIVKISWCLKLVPQERILRRTACQFFFGVLLIVEECVESPHVFKKAQWNRLWQAARRCSRSTTLSAQERILRHTEKQDVEVPVLLVTEEILFAEFGSVLEQIVDVPSP